MFVAEYRAVIADHIRATDVCLEVGCAGGLTTARLAEVLRERVWLVSTFTAGGEGDPEFAVLDESLQSFEVVSLASH